MIQLILISLFLLGSQANECFERCDIFHNYFNYGEQVEEPAIIGEGAYTDISSLGSTNGLALDAMDKLPLTNYHCILKCANKLTKATMGLALDNLHEKFNAQCIMIENLDYCVQYWKQWNEDDCEEPIKNMVKQNFQVSTTKSLRKTILYTKYFVEYI